MAIPGSWLSEDARRAQRAIEVFREYAVRDMLSVYANLEERADKVTNEEFERLGSEPAGEDFDGDMSGAAEAAQDAGIAFYETMTGLRQSTLNLFAAGLFHLVEQHAAYLCHQRWGYVDPPVDGQLHVVADWYSRHFGLDLRSLPEWPLIDELRLVANTVKHAEGRSAEQLRARRPELFEHPVIRELVRREGQDSTPFFPPLRLPLAGEGLFVTEQTLHEYISAAARFFNGVATYFDNHAKDYYPLE